MPIVYYINSWAIIVSLFYKFDVQEVRGLKLARGVSIIQLLELDCIHLFASTAM